ncbi:hypothetical protein LCGC14_2257440 [marine sediment metagenome]|uniref:Uncharacterized protein n=1 Tax=marine sediment metagenome TaxID=412755 RepID=A0A0F9D0K4_9ZZZZ
MISAIEADTITGAARNDKYHVRVTELLHTIETHIVDAAHNKEQDVNVDLPTDDCENDCHTIHAVKVVCSHLEALGYCVQYNYCKNLQHWLHICWNFPKTLKFSVQQEEAVC